MASPLTQHVQELLQAWMQVGLLLAWWSLRFVLFVPLLLLRWNLRFNPICIAGRRLLLRALLHMDSATKQLAELQLQELEKRAETKHPVQHDDDDDVALDSSASSSSNSQSTTPGAMEAPPLRWLRPNERAGEHVAIVSYPRCGNSLMRGLLERITGVFSGCDTHPKRALSQQLRDCGMCGEGVVDDSVWFVKSHYPERVGWKPFDIQKAIVIVRNPWDAIDSYFNMTLTNTHTKSLHESMYERFAERWDGLLRHETDVWMKFYRFWTTQVEIPIIVVRYEDLLMHRAESLRRVFLFLTDRSSLDGTEWQARIDDAMATGGDKTGPYKPRVGKIGASFKHYSDEQFQHILKTAQLPLRGFGYDPETQGFPDQLRLPSRQVKKGSKPNAVFTVPIDQATEIRKRDDPYGRHATRFRKALTEPVIANDGTELNLHEVDAARAHLQAQAQAAAE